jgi:IS30 family transposase
MIDPTTLYRLYVEERRSIRNIALLLHVAPRTVHTAMMRARIPRRKCWEVHRPAVAGLVIMHQLDEARLRQLYLVENYSIREIATRVGTCATTIQQALVKWNIPRRKRGRAHRITDEAAHRARAAGA